MRCSSSPSRESDSTASRAFESGVACIRLPWRSRCAGCGVKGICGENSIKYGDGEWQPTVNILEFRGDKVAHETIYITERWSPPDWRAPWRSAP